MKSINQLLTEDEYEIRVSEKEQQINILTSLMKEALEIENYELMAKIRDKLFKLN